MKKASYVLLKISRISGIILGIITIQQILLWGILELGILSQVASTTPSDKADEMIGYVLLFLIIMFVYFVVMLFICAGCAKRTIEDSSKKNMIKCIIFGALALFVPIILGAIFGLVALNREKDTSQVIDV